TARTRARALTARAARPGAAGPRTARTATGITATTLAMGARRTLIALGCAGRQGESRHRRAFYGALDELLDGSEQLDLVLVDKRHGRACRTCAAGTADTVDVVLGHIGQLEVHDLGQLVDIQA